MRNQKKFEKVTRKLYFMRTRGVTAQPIAIIRGVVRGDYDLIFVRSLMSMGQMVLNIEEVKTPGYLKTHTDLMRKHYDL